MVLRALEGVYEDGKIELKELPHDLKRARVLVMFLPDDLVKETDPRDGELRREAGERLLKAMRKGIDFGGEKFNREEIYEDRIGELESRRG